MKDLKITLLIIVALAVVAVVFGSLFFSQRYLLKKEKAKITALEQDLKGKESEIREYGLTIRRLEQGKVKLAEEAVNLKVEIAKLEQQFQGKETPAKEVETQLAALDEEEVLETEESADTEVKKTGGFMGKQKEAFREMLKNPEMREMIREAHKNQLDMMYGDLFKKLWLNPEDLEAFKELLTDTGMLEMEIAMGTDNDRNDTETKEARNEIKEEIEELLGEEKYNTYTDYANTLEERMVVSQYKKRLTRNEINPLTEYQEEQLVKVMKDEKANIDFSINMENPDDFSKLTTENVDTLIKEMDEMNKLVLERSREFLSEEQFNEYKASVESFLEMRKMQLKMAIKMFGGGGETTPATTKDTGVGE